MINVNSQKVHLAKMYLPLLKCQPLLNIRNIFLPLLTKALREKPHVSPCHIGRGRARSIRAADRLFWGACRYRRFIVALSSLSRASGSSIYRRYIVNIYIDDISVKCDIFLYLVQAPVKGSRVPCLKGSHLRGTRHKKHNTDDPIHHRRSLCDHPHGHAKGPWSPRGRLKLW